MRMRMCWTLGRSSLPLSRSDSPFHRFAFARWTLVSIPPCTYSLPFSLYAPPRYALKACSTSSSYSTSSSQSTLDPAVVSSSSSQLTREIAYFASRPQSPISLKTLYLFGKNSGDKELMYAAKFLHTELAIRIAHRIMEIEQAPYDFHLMSAVKQVRDLYVESFRMIREHKDFSTPEDELKFTEILREIKLRHSWVIQTMAEGVLQLKRRLKRDHLGKEIQKLLERFYAGRISIRMLIGQHIALHDVPSDKRAAEADRSGYVGMINQYTCPAEIAQDAAAHARHLCEVYYGVAPEVSFHGDTSLTFTYVPAHLYLILFELLKNSMRATVEFHGPNSTSFPRIRIIIANGVEDVTIKISDEGGGIPRSALDLVWTFSYTTASSAEGTSDLESKSDVDPLAGYGYGLPISRLYARYFGGDMNLMSMEGYGIDAFIFLPRLADREEALP